MSDRLAEWFRGLEEWRAGLAAEVETLERELLVVTAERDELRRLLAAQAPPPIVPPPPVVQLAPAWDEERRQLLAALDHARGVQKDAAALLAMSPRMLHYKMRRFGLVTRSSRGPYRARARPEREGV